MPLNKPLSAFDLAPCEVVPQKEPTKILTETSQIGITLDFKKLVAMQSFQSVILKATLTAW